VCTWGVAICIFLKRVKTNKHVYIRLQTLIQKYKREHTKKFSKFFSVHGNKIAMLFTQQFVCKSVELMLG